ncbi:hypothetical protein EUX98_g5718 [Antrodiella citrinella]|uniref:Uncharacterized protein n=1 Tax=Antrodiella citrinella TaxID=2447956 RepID=A0A4S4MRQ4_9APHY|nr:hypothetical protein EUX98_g5718 [Antrodiella citrinella]
MRRRDIVVRPNGDVYIHYNEFQTTILDFLDKLARDVSVILDTEELVIWLSAMPTEYRDLSRRVDPLSLLRWITVIPCSPPPINPELSSHLWPRLSHIDSFDSIYGLLHSDNAGTRHPASLVSVARKPERAPSNDEPSDIVRITVGGESDNRDSDGGDSNIADGSSGDDSKGGDSAALLMRTSHRSTDRAELSGSPSTHPSTVHRDRSQFVGGRPELSPSPAPDDENDSDSDSSGDDDSNISDGSGGDGSNGGDSNSGGAASTHILPTAHANLSHIPSTRSQQTTRRDQLPFVEEDHLQLPPSRAPDDDDDSDGGDSNGDDSGAFLMHTAHRFPADHAGLSGSPSMHPQQTVQRDRSPFAGGRPELSPSPVPNDGNDSAGSNNSDGDASDGYDLDSSDSDSGGAVLAHITPTVTDHTGLRQQTAQGERLPFVEEVHFELSPLPAPNDEDDSGSNDSDGDDSDGDDRDSGDSDSGGADLAHTSPTDHADHSLISIPPIASHTLPTITPDDEIPGLDFTVWKEHAPRHHAEVPPPRIEVDEPESFVAQEPIRPQGPSYMQWRSVQFSSSRVSLPNDFFGFPSGGLPQDDQNFEQQRSTPNSVQRQNPLESSPAIVHAKTSPAARGSRVQTMDDDSSPTLGFKPIPRWYVSPIPSSSGSELRPKINAAQSSQTLLELPALPSQAEQLSDEEIFTDIFVQHREQSFVDHPSGQSADS